MPTGSLGADGRAVVDDAAFSAAFDAVARAAGYDPAARCWPPGRSRSTSPLAAGTPRTSGFVDDPVCTATGHFLEVEEDFTWPDRLGVLRWRRTYSSRFVAGGPFGRGWASWASRALVPDGTTASVGYQGPDGQMAVFTPRPTGPARRGTAASPACRPGWRAPDGRLGAALGLALRPARRGVGVRRRRRWCARSSGPPPAPSLRARRRAAGRRWPTRAAAGSSSTGTAPGSSAVRSSCGRVARYHYNDAGDLVRSRAGRSATAATWSTTGAASSRCGTPTACGCAATPTTTRAG